jgi:hypothetical protein
MGGSVNDDWEEARSPYLSLSLSLRPLPQTNMDLLTPTLPNRRT